MLRNYLSGLGLLGVLLFPQAASAVRSAELYTSASYAYGRFEARIRFAAGDGIISSLFLWKDKSEQAGAFWNELDFEKLGADCGLETNPIYGNPAGNHNQKHPLGLDLCGGYHTYTYEWTPEAIVWKVDGMQVRRETGEVAQAFAQNASGGMQIHLNVWPGDESFGGNFNPAILPVHQYVDWVQYSAYSNGEFKLSWREDFNGNSLPSGWLAATWASPKNKSTHATQNVNFINGYAVLSLTADNATGPAGAMPGAGSGAGGGGAGGSGAGGGGTGGAGGAGGTSGSGAGGSPTAGAGGASSAGAGGTLSGGAGFGGAATGGGGAGGTSGAASAGTAGALPSSGGTTTGSGGTPSGSGTGGGGAPVAGSGGAPMAVPVDGGGCAFGPVGVPHCGLWALTGAAVAAWLLRRPRRV